MNDLPQGFLRQKREQMKLTPEDVVHELEKRGIDLNVKTLYGYENGVSTPRVNTFIALCDIYKISDVMGEFGYSSELKLATGNNEWNYDEYNDFFNGTLLEKIYLLLKKGVPSFSGYEEQLRKCFPSDADAANFERLYSLFSSLDEPGQGLAFELLEQLVQQRFPIISQSDMDQVLISASKNSSQEALKQLVPILNQMNSNGIEILLENAEFLVSNAKYQKKQNLA